MRYINRFDIFTILHYLGRIMIVIGLMFLIPIIVDLIYGEFNFLSYLIASAISASIGYVLNRGFNTPKKMKLKHGMIISSLSWIWACFIGTICMMLILNISFLDGFFENMSIFTNSGFTIFFNVETLPNSILFLRSFESWVGGLGVVVMVLGVLAHYGTAATKLYKSEARDEKIKPSVTNTLNKTLKIYLIYTVLGIVLYLLAGMPVFDAVCNTFSTISTGGMSIKNANIGYYKNDLIYIITMILMILGATSFMVHYKIIKTRGKSLLQDVQFRVMISLIIIASIIVYLISNIMPIEIVFHLISAITTTGASITPSSQFITWPPVVILITVILMMMGGSSGSTVGAIKLMRVIVFFKGIYKNIKSIISPEGRVITVKLSGQKISDKTILEASSYIILYIIFIVIGWAFFCYFGYDPLNSLFEIASAQGNCGISTGIIDYNLHPVLKVVTIFNMWSGRLEIIPVLVMIRSVFEIFKK